MMANTLIHVARIQPKGKRQPHYLFLRKEDPHRYTWFEDHGDSELKTAISALELPEALRQANHFWKAAYFQSVMCGFRYTLPERDEHGENALFFQMVASYSSPTGVYFDDDLGHTCIVQNASQEARQIWERLKNRNKL